jgi:hypothetical protein
MKLPFIETFLEDFIEVEKIKELIDENKCDIILYSDIDNETDLDDYDYIILTREDDLEDAFENKCGLYRNKLFFVGNYENDYEYYWKYHDVLKEIKSGLNINCFMNSMKKSKISINNFTQYVSISNDCVHESSSKKYASSKILTKKYNKTLPYLPSSIIQFSGNFNNFFAAIILNNLPNKIKITNLNCIFPKSMVLKKIPIGTVYILNIKNLPSIKMNLNKFRKLTQLMILNVYNKDYIDRQLGRLAYYNKTYNDNVETKTRMCSFYLAIDNYEYQIINNYYEFNKKTYYSSNNLYSENTNINLFNCVTSVYDDNNDSDESVTDESVIDDRTKFIWKAISNSFSTYGQKIIVNKKLYNSQILCSFCDPDEIEKINDHIDFYVKMLQS